MTRRRRHTAKPDTWRHGGAFGSTFHPAQGSGQSTVNVTSTVWLSNGNGTFSVVTDNWDEYRM